MVKLAMPSSPYDQSSVQPGRVATDEAEHHEQGPQPHRAPRMRGAPAGHAYGERFLSIVDVLPGISKKTSSRYGRAPRADPGEARGRPLVRPRGQPRGGYQ